MTNHTRKFEGFRIVFGCFFRVRLDEQITPKLISSLQIHQKWLGSGSVYVSNAFVVRNLNFDNVPTTD